jgi:hypothetical protein
MVKCCISKVSYDLIRDRVLEKGEIAKNYSNCYSFEMKMKWGRQSKSKKFVQVE